MQEIMSAGAFLKGTFGHFFGWVVRMQRILSPLLDQQGHENEVRDHDCRPEHLEVPYLTEENHGHLNKRDS